MSSGQHTTRRQPSLRDVSRRDLRTVLNYDRQRTADVRQVVYVGRLGRVKHMVRNQGSDTIYVVAGPDKNFDPGSQVLAGSNTGRPGESIISTPPLDRRGASGYPEAKFGSSLGFPEPAPICPSYSSGHDYLGLWSDETDTLYAWEYRDGTQGSLINTKTYSLGGRTVRMDRAKIDRSESNRVVVFDADELLVTWNVDSNSLSTVDSGGSSVAHWYVEDGIIYFTLGGAPSATRTLWKVAVGATSGVSTHLDIDLSSEPGDWRASNVMIPLGGGEFLNVAKNNDDGSFKWVDWNGVFGDSISSEIGESGDSVGTALYVGILDLDAASGSYGMMASSDLFFREDKGDIANAISLARVDSSGTWNHIIPHQWEIVGDVRFYPNPAGTEFSVFAVHQSGDGEASHYLLRVPLQGSEIEPECGLPWVFVERPEVSGFGTIPLDAMVSLD